MRLRTAVLAVSIIGAAVFGLALVSGVVYEQVQRTRDRDRLPQVGRSVDIGGRTLNLYCSGVGQPAVILERGAPWLLYTNPKAMYQNGSPRPGYGWVSIARELAKTSTTCWYDRAGSGWSDVGPYPRDSASQARDLHALLKAAGVPPPYVLAAESSAALDAHVFAGYYPDEVAGFVFIDGVHPDLMIKTRPGNGNMGRLPEFFFSFTGCRRPDHERNWRLSARVAEETAASPAHRDFIHRVEYHLEPEPVREGPRRTHAGYRLLAAERR